LVAEGRWDEVVTRAFGTPLVWGPHHDKLPGEEAMDKSAKTYEDAWSSSSSLKLGTLEHVTTEQELENILISLCTLPPPLLPLWDRASCRNLTLWWDGAQTRRPSVHPQAKHWACSLSW
jgi:hypothetical protein